MTNFDHVTDSTVRAALAGNQSAINDALAITAACVNADMSDPDVDLTALDARIAAYEAAADALATNDLDACIAALRDCWSV